MSKPKAKIVTIHNDYLPKNLNQFIELNRDSPLLSRGEQGAQGADAPLLGLNYGVESAGLEVR